MHTSERLGALRQTPIAAIMALAILGVLPVTTSADVVLPVDTLFPGQTTLASGSPVATFAQGINANTVQLVMTFGASSPVSSTEKIGEWYFNFNPGLNVSGLTITNVSGITATVSQSTDGLKADGNGGDFDFKFGFPTADASAFKQGNTSVWNLVYGSAINPNDFLFLSVSDPKKPGSFYSAAHIQGIGTDSVSTWQGAAVPEPSPLLLGLLSGCPIVGVGYLRRRRQAKADTA